MKVPSEPHSPLSYHQVLSSLARSSFSRSSSTASVMRSLHMTTACHVSSSYTCAKQQQQQRNNICVNQLGPPRKLTLRAVSSYRFQGQSSRSDVSPKPNHSIVHHHTYTYSNHERQSIRNRGFAQFCHL